MKIYFGKNKKQAKQIDLFDLIHKLSSNNITKEMVYLNDGSYIGIDFIFDVGKKQITVSLGSTDVDDQFIEEVKVWEEIYKLDPDSQKRIN